MSADSEVEYCRQRFTQMAEIITNAKLLKKGHFTVRISSYIQIQSVKSLCERIGLRCPSSMTMIKMVG